MYTLFGAFIKRELWNELVDFRNKFPRGECCIIGDFNIVKKEMERKGISSQINQIKMQEFQYFLEGLDVVYVAAIGKKTYLV